MYIRFRHETEKISPKPKDSMYLAHTITIKSNS